MSQPHNGLVFLLLMAPPCFAQLTIGGAIRDAAERYPGVRASLEQVNAAAAAVSRARTSRLPRADLAGQLNRATHNNVFGMTFPNGVIPSISGPVLRSNSLDSVWGTSAGVMVQWEPFDFGLRQANVAVAQAGRERAAAQVAVTRLQASAAAADAYLSILAAQRTVAAAQAAVDRARTLGGIVDTLVRAELRPGADASRIRAELAVAENQLIQSQEAVALGRAALSQVLGIPPAQVEVVAGKLLELPRQTAPAAPAAGTHPAAIAQNAAIDEVKARERALDRSWYPKFNLESALYARGTGIQPDGSTGNAASGLGPNIQNWGVGLNVTFPLFELPALKAKKEIEHYRERSEQARYSQVLQEIDGEVARAEDRLDAARRIAANVPVQLEAARATERQATARYRAGLGTLVEVAEAQRLRTQSEIDDALARLAVWRALLGLATAHGDLTGFVQLAQ
jgi:outer membrane protein